MNTHPLHIAFENWKLSEEGHRCHDGRSIQLPDQHGVYLANRLAKAYYSGAEAQYKIDESPIQFRRLVKRILSYKGRTAEQIIQELKKALK